MNKTKAPWIKIGYEIFALEGPNALKVEVIARRVGKSKSSFYHHFADLEVFTEVLLDHHLDQARLMAIKESNCKNVIPELLHVFLDHPTDLFFNRQLRVHRSIPHFNSCLEKVNQIVGEAILGIWSDMLNLNHNSYLAMMVLNLSIENFYLQITPETLNYEWLKTYVLNLKHMARAFQNDKKNSPIGR